MSPQMTSSIWIVQGVRGKTYGKAQCHLGLNRGVSYVITQWDWSASQSFKHYDPVRCNRLPMTSCLLFFPAREEGPVADDMPPGVCNLCVRIVLTLGCVWVAEWGDRCTLVAYSCPHHPLYMRLLR